MLMLLGALVKYQMAGYVACMGKRCMFKI